MQIKKLLSKTELIKPGKHTEFLLLTLLAIISVMALLYATIGGLIWTSDSFNYWAASRSFAAEGNFTAVDGGTYIFWPPLFPVILSIFNNYEAYFSLHLVVFALAIFTIFYCFKAITKNGFVSLMAVGLYSLSVYPYLAGSFLWSENLFILLCYGSIYFYKKSEEKQRRWIYFTLAMLLGCLMCLQRNAGIFILVSFSIYELLNFLNKKISLKILLIKALLIFLAVLPNMLWNLRSLQLQGVDNEIINRSYFIYFWSNLLASAERLISLLSPTLITQNIYLNIGCLVILLSLLFFMRQIKLVQLILITYVTLLCLMPLIPFESFDRLLSPLSPLLFLGFSTIIYHNFIIKKDKLRLFFAGLFIITLCYNVLRTTQNLERWHERSLAHPREHKIFF